MITKEQLIQIIKNNCTGGFSLLCDEIKYANNMSIKKLLYDLNKVLDKPDVKESLTTDLKVGDEVWFIYNGMVDVSSIVSETEQLYWVHVFNKIHAVGFKKSNIFKTKAEAEQSIKGE